MTAAVVCCEVEEKLLGGDSRDSLLLLLPFLFRRHPIGRFPLRRPLCEKLQGGLQGTEPLEGLHREQQLRAHGENTKLKEKKHV